MGSNSSIGYLPEGHFSLLFVVKIVLGLFEKTKINEKDGPYLIMIFEDSLLGYFQSLGASVWLELFFYNIHLGSSYKVGSVGSPHNFY